MLTFAMKNVGLATKLVPSVVFATQVSSYVEKETVKFLRTVSQAANEQFSFMSKGSSVTSSYETGSETAVGIYEEGACVGSTDCAKVGAAEGTGVWLGCLVGLNEGFDDGDSVGTGVGASVGDSVGTLVGTCVGNAVGTADGSNVGEVDGIDVGV